MHAYNINIYRKKYEQEESLFAILPCLEQTSWWEQIPNLARTLSWSWLTLWLVGHSPDRMDWETWVHTPPHSRPRCQWVCRTEEGSERLVRTGYSKTEM